MTDKTTDKTDPDLEWADKQDELVQEGRDLLGRASDEALDYLKDALENYDDRQWRKMTVESQAVEMGVGQVLAETLIPRIYKDMEKNMHKRLKVTKLTAEALRHIYIGRVIKNVRKELNQREDRQEL